MPNANAIHPEKQKLIDRIMESPEPVYVRHGLGWKGAEWYKTSKKSLCQQLTEGNYAHYDVCKVDGCLGVAFYSSNDMM